MRRNVKCMMKRSANVFSCLVWLASASRLFTFHGVCILNQTAPAVTIHNDSNLSPGIQHKQNMHKYNSKSIANNTRRGSDVVHTLVYNTPPPAPQHRTYHTKSAVSNIILFPTCMSCLLRQLTRNKETRIYYTYY